MGKDIFDNELNHFGILGMKWGIRRYQSKDGSLTELGKKRLNYDRYVSGRTTDSTVKKGTKVSRFVQSPYATAYERKIESTTDPKEKKEWENKYKGYMDNQLNTDKNLDTKYVSVDNQRNTPGKPKGTDFYADVFTYSFTQKANAPLTMYEVKKDLRVASAQQVINHLVKDAGSVTIKSLIKNGGDIRNITMNYTWNRPYKETVNERFKKKGYDAIDDPNDPDSDMPIIVFNAKENLGQPYSTESGAKAIDRILKERAKKALNKK